MLAVYRAWNGWQSWNHAICEYHRSKVDLTLLKKNASDRLFQTFWNPALKKSDLNPEVGIILRVKTQTTRILKIAQNSVGEIKILKQEKTQEKLI